MDTLLLATDTCPKVESYGKNDIPRSYRYASRQEGEFWKQYCAAVADKKLTVPYAEFMPRQHPVVVSFSVMCPAPDNISAYDSWFYSNNLIDIAVKAAQDAISEVLSEKPSEYLTCFFIASKSYKYDTDKVRVDYRIHFPLCRLENADQNKYLYPKLCKSFTKNNVFLTIGLDLVTTKAEECISQVSENTTIPLYGSSPYNDNRGAPAINYIYNHNSVLVIDWTEVSSLFSPEHHTGARITNADDHKWTYWLPVILSIEWNGGEVYVPKVVSKNSGEDEELQAYRSPDELVAVEMLGLIHSSYAKAGWARKKIMKALYNIFKGRKEGFSLFMEWCSKCKDLVMQAESYYEYKYRVCSRGNYLTIVTLQQLAQQHSPIEYRVWFNNVLIDKMQESAKRRTPGAVAEAADHFFKTQFTCIEGKWYEHMGSYLKPFRFNRTNLKPLTVRIQVAAKLEDSPKRGSELNYDMLLKQLENPTFLGQVKTMLADMYSTRTEGVILDADGRLFPAVHTYVIEMKKKYGAIERRGLLEDYFVSHGDVPLLSDFSTDDPAFQRERKFVRETLRDGEVIDYADRKRTKDFLAPSGEKSIEIYIGPPNSGKTTDLKIDKRIFGSLQFGHSPTVVTGNSNASSGPTPETAHTNFRKRVVMDDPESTDGKSPNIGWLTRESGYANRMSRFLNQDGGDNEAVANIIILMNDAMNLPPLMQLKIRVIARYYLAQYLTATEAKSRDKVIPDTYEEQYAAGIFPIATISESDLLEMATARFNYSVMLAKKTDWEKPLMRPDAVTIATESFWSDYDPYTKFKERFLRRDLKSKVHADMLYDVFEQWYKKKYHLHSAPLFKTFISCMKGVLYVDKDRNDYYPGYRIEDPVFTEFIETNLYTAPATVILDSKIAWMEFRNWRDMSGQETHIKNLEQFVSYMIAAGYEYIRRKGFKGITTSTS